MMVHEPQHKGFLDNIPDYSLVMISGYRQDVFARKSAEFQVN